MGERFYAYVVSAVLIGAVAYPFAWQSREDSFPLSTYPMFSGRMATPEVSIPYALGIEANGKRHHLQPDLVANDEVLQARAVLERAVAGGSAEAGRLCSSIARRVAKRNSLRDVTMVRVVTGRHDAVAYLTGKDRTGAESVHAMCPVGRP